VASACLVLAGSCAASEVMAHDRRPISIPAGRLDAALRTLATRTGRQILFDPGVIGGRTTRGLRGARTPEAALRELLAGSGLAAHPLRGGIFIIVAVPPSAAEPLSAGQLTEGGEVVVTALKRATLLQDTEISMDVVSGPELEQRGAFDLARAGALLPGVTLFNTGALQQHLAVRGVSGTGEATVGVYYGETPVSGPAGTTFDPGASTPDIDLVDVDRLELLRGPQGTLYGAGSMGGTLRVLFNRANPAGMDARGEAGVALTRSGSLGASASAMLNLPLIPNQLAVRVAAQRRRASGYIDNDRLAIHDVGAVDRESLRIGIGWTLSPSLRVDALLLQQRTRIDDAGFWSADLSRYHSEQATRTPNRERLTLGSLTLRWEQDDWVLVATGSRYRWRILKQGDYTEVLAQQRGDAAACRRYAGLPDEDACSAAQLSAFGAFLDTRLPSILHQPFTVESSSAEVRLSSPGDRAVSWTAGAFVEHRRDRAESYTLRADARSGTLIEPFDVIGLRLLSLSLDQQALFAEGRFALVPRLSATVGGRYYRYAREARGWVPTPNILTGTAAMDDTPFHSESEGTNLKAELAYRVPGGPLLYAIAAEGFRPGGVNVTPGLGKEARAYEADHVWSYELGAKTGGGRPFLLEGAAYHLDWDNTIFSIASVNGAFVYNTNLGRVKINGIEAKAGLRLGVVSLTGAASYTDARLGEDQMIGTVEGTGRRGDRLPNVPRWTYTIAAEASRDLREDLVGTLGATVAASGATASAFRSGRFYEETAARLTVDLHGELVAGKHSLGLVVSNLFDAVAPIRLSSSSFGERRLYSSAPRTIALRLATTM
jgi:outer membrane receptor protein involved in Fe transport